MGSLTASVRTSPFLETGRIPCSRQVSWGRAVSACASGLTRDRRERLVRDLHDQIASVRMRIDELVPFETEFEDVLRLL